MTPDQIEPTLDTGFTFVALGSDSGQVVAGMRGAAAAFEPYRGR